MACPGTTTTLFNASTTYFDCLCTPPPKRNTKEFTSSAVCLPGQYSATGLGPCTLCPIGNYSTASRQTSCRACPADTTTRNRGTAALSGCVGTPPTLALSSYSAKGFARSASTHPLAWGPARLAPSASVTPPPLLLFILQTPMPRARRRAQPARPDSPPPPLARLPPSTAQVHPPPLAPSLTFSGACGSGTISPTGLMPCAPCPVGTYQPVSRQSSCVRCGNGLSTVGTGATASSQCIC